MVGSTAGGSMFIVLPRRHILPDSLSSGSNVVITWMWEEVCSLLQRSFSPPLMLS